MSNLFRTRYRIVTDKYAGYEAQFRYWWMPFYVMCFGCNTRSSLNHAIELINMHKKEVIWKE